jgi:hypothetical protein
VFARWNVRPDSALLNRKSFADRPILVGNASMPRLAEFTFADHRAGPQLACLNPCSPSRVLSANKIRVAEPEDFDLIGRAVLQKVLFTTWTRCHRTSV